MKAVRSLGDFLSHSFPSRFGETVMERTEEASLEHKNAVRPILLLKIKVDGRDLPV